MFGSLMRALGANPSAVDKVFTLVIITAGLVESIALLIALFALLVAFVIK
jgi:F0F1-type ATP synthase membrane subunit c/vacuolar-type H+-ATPase subunit K